MNILQRKINIIDVIREAWTLIKGTKWPIFKRMLLAAILGAVVVMIFTYILFITKNLSSTSHLLLNFAVMIIMAYIYIKILIPAYIIGVKRALGLTIDINTIKAECARARINLRVLILFLVLLIPITNMIVKLIPLSFVGVIFTYILYFLNLCLIIPIYFFAFPLIILNKQDTTAAINSVYKNMAIYWKEVLGANIILLFIFGVIISTISYLQNLTAQSHHIFDIFYYHIFDILYYILQFLVAVWFVPLQFITNGILFRKIYNAKNISEINPN